MALSLRAARAPRGNAWCTACGASLIECVPTIGIEIRGAFVIETAWRACKCGAMMRTSRRRRLSN